MSISVVLADDQALVRTGFRLILQATGDISVVGEAGDGKAAADLAIKLSPDIVLMDVRMPRCDGVEGTRLIRTAAAGAPVPRVIILTTYDIDEYVYAGLRAGASGFLLKDVLAADLLTAIRTVARGDTVLAPSAVRRLIERFVHRSPVDSAAAKRTVAALTPRECEVLTLIGQGLTNKEIADHLVVSEGTVKTHVGRVLAKLNARDRVHAVITAYDAGLVRVGIH